MPNAERFDSFAKDVSAGRVSLFDDLKVTSIGIIFEQQARDAGFRFIAGVDEVGRGCLAGPVVAGACILDLDKPLPKGLNDSKKLTANKRDEIAAQLRADCLAYAVAEIQADEIDRINILEATKNAMLLAIGSLMPAADFLLIDALQLKSSSLPQKTIIKGDTISASIAAASVLAKTYRDDLMKSYDVDFPQYGFAGHKGYGAAVHLNALREHGPCRLHRMTFKGVCSDEKHMPLF
jgi:ribonuclease HII